MRQLVYLVVAGSMLAACSDSTVSAPEAVQPGNTLASVNTKDGDLQLVARSLAKAFADPEVRSSLRNAWRDSHISTDHKLVLRDFFTSPEGASFVSKMAIAEGKASSDLLAVINRLPEMDIYLPIREHRTTWRGTSDILVGATFDQTADRIQAYDVTGAVRTVLGADAAKGPPLVVLHPAEPKYASVTSERYGSGDLIELPDSYDVVAPMVRQAVRSSGNTGLVTGGTANSMIGGVYLKYFDTYRTDGPFGGDLEMEFRTYGVEGGTPYYNYSGGFWYLNGTSCHKGTLAANFPANPPQYTNQLVASGVTAANRDGCGGFGSPKHFFVQLFEMDQPGLEDDFGTRVTGCLLYNCSQPYGLLLTTTSAGTSQYYYSGDGTTSGQKSVFMAMQIDP